jgi:hypothetical protein
VVFGEDASSNSLVKIVTPVMLAAVSRSAPHQMIAQNQEIHFGAQEAV